MKQLTVVILVFYSICATSEPLGLWSGHWVGACKLNPAYMGVTEFNASLRVGESDLDGIQWQLIYEANGNFPEQIRNYTLRHSGQSPTHYLLDENNGIVLDTFVGEMSIYSHFAINGNLVTTSYLLTDKDTMVLDMPMFHLQPIGSSCLRGNPNLCAESFGLKQTQRCKLQRQQ